MASRGSRVKGTLPPVEKAGPQTAVGANDEKLYPGLLSWLQTQLTNFKAARKPQEANFFEAYQDYWCIPRRGDTRVNSGYGSGSIGLPVSKSESVFLRWTRNKVRSFVSMANNVLFGSGKEIPVAFDPTDERWQPLCDALMEIITWQCEEGGWREAVKDAELQMGIYGSGQITGPDVRLAKRDHAVADPATGKPVLVPIEHPQPFFRAPLTLDWYADPNATTNDPGKGGFEVIYFSPDIVKTWKKRPGYMNVEEAAAMITTARKGEGSDQARNLHANVNPSVEGKVEVAWYSGLVPKEYLAGHEALSDEKYADEEMVFCRIGFCPRGVLLKVDIRPVQRYVNRCFYENPAGEAYAPGIGENNAISLKLGNAALRLLVTNKGLALNPARSVDRSKFQAGEDFKQAPGKVYNFKPNLSPEEKENAIIVHETPDVSEGWDSLIELATQMSDDDTGLRKIQQGEGEQDLTRTAHGISMILNAASLPIKEILANFDKQIIEPSIQALIDWDLRYLEPDIVAVALGPDAAQKWAQIKQLGKVEPLMTFRATGASTFVAKEMLIQKVQSFMQIIGSNPAYFQLVDVRELLETVWDAMETGKKNPVKSEDEVKQMQATAQQKQAEAEEMAKAKMVGEHAVDVADALNKQKHAELEAQRVMHDKIKTVAQAADMAHGHIMASRPEMVQ